MLKGSIESSTCSVISRGERTGVFEQAIGQRRRAAIDVRDDAEAANVLFIHGGEIIPQTRKT